MLNQETLVNLKKPLITIIEGNLPVSYSRQEADSFFGISINEKGKMTGEGYAQEVPHLETMDWRDLPLLELTFLVSEILGDEELLNF